MQATIVGNGWLRPSEAVLGFRLLTKFPESLSIARLLVPQLIESFWEPFPQTLGRLKAVRQAFVPTEDRKAFFTGLLLFQVS